MNYDIYSYAPNGRQLGFVVNPATVSAAISVSNGLKSLFGGNSKEQARIQANIDAYKLAAAGRQDAMEYLKYRSGRYGTAQSIGPAWEGGGPVGGWATQTARDDAWRLYQSALAIYGIGIDPNNGGQTPGGAYTPNPTDPGSPEDLHPQGLPGVTVTGKMDYLPLVLVAGAALLLAKRRG